MASSKYQFSKKQKFPFAILVREDVLFGLSALIKKHLGVSSVECDLSFKDDTFVEGLNLENLINQESDRIDKLYSIEIDLKNDDDLKYTKRIKISLGHFLNNSIELGVSGDDKDWVRLVYLDLEEQLLKLKNYSFFSKTFFYCLSPFVEALSVPLLASIPPIAITVLSPYEIFKKFLKSYFADNLFIFFISSVSISYLILKLLFKLFEHLFPVIVFDFGNQKGINEERKRIRSNIFWVIFVSGALSILFKIFI